jgi:hypothetical protein
MIQYLLQLIFDRLILPIVDQKFQAFRIQSNFETAKKLLSSSDREEATKGLSIIRRLVRDDTLNLQEYYDSLCDFIRNTASKDKPYPQNWSPVIKSALILLCSLPKYDRNQWPYNIELSNILLDNLTLHCLNFENAALYDSVFRKVDFSRSSFKNCDLGGCQFIEASSVEWCNFQNSLMNVSFLSGNTTSFLGTRIWGSNLDEARIAKCIIQNVDHTNLEDLMRKHGSAIQMI